MRQGMTTVALIVALGVIFAVGDRSIGDQEGAGGFVAEARRELWSLRLPIGAVSGFWSFGRVEPRVDEAVPPRLVEAEFTFRRSDFRRAIDILFSIGVSQETLREYTPELWVMEPQPWKPNSFTGQLIGSECWSLRSPKSADWVGVKFLQGNTLVRITYYPLGDWVLTRVPVSDEEIAFVEDIARLAEAKVIAWELWGTAGIAVTLKADGKTIRLPATPSGDKDYLVPVEMLIGRLGGETSWDAKAQTMAGKLRGKQLALTAGRRDFQADGRQLSLDVAPEVVKGRLVGPVGLLEVVFGTHIDWQRKPGEVPQGVVGLGPGG